MSSMILGIMLIAPLWPSASCAQPWIRDPYEIVDATIQGGGPLTVDPAYCYDSDSGELLINVYDTLLSFDGEHVDKYVLQLATERVVENITGTVSPEGLPWYFRYVFKIRENVPFHDPTFGFLTPADVEYCFERAMVLDVNSEGNGPQWMFYEPLLNAYSAYGLNASTMPNDADIVKIGKMIDHAVESNSTHVWFNLAFPGVYPQFLQILSSPWSSIYSKAWANSLGRPTNWDGNWGNYTGWWTYHSPAVPPFDDPTPVAMGTGPFVLEALDSNLKQWSANRFVNYWRGWPADWPSAAGSQPRGYINRFVVTWAYEPETRSTMLLNGDVDFCTVTVADIAKMLGKPGIRCIYPLPSLAVDAFFYNFNISQTSPYGPILPSGVFSESGIPSDFFGNSSWGVHIRKAFSYAIDYDKFIAEEKHGEATHPATAIIPGLPYYDPTVKGYTLNVTRAAEEFKQVPGLWNTGFTVQLLYNEGSLPRNAVQNSIKSAIESLNPKFHVTVLGVSWSEYLAARTNGQLVAYTLGWLADYPDPHDFAFAFYYSKGNDYLATTFAQRQGYNSTAMDALVDTGMKVPDGPERAQIYRDMQQLAVDDCPCTALDQPFSRHFERDWIVGWYNCPWYSCYQAGNYAYNLWKWYYVPHSLNDTLGQPGSSYFPADVNYDGTVNIVDITVVAQAFGSSFGPPMNPRWNFRTDINNDRRISIADIAVVAKNFGKPSATWIPPS